MSWQTVAADMELLLGAQEITWEQAAYFSLGAALETALANPEEAFAFARERGWLPKNVRAEETARMDSVSLLLMRSFNVPGGFMYRIFPNAPVIQAQAGTGEVRIGGFEWQ